jgi:hypothetical protein
MYGQEMRRVKHMRYWKGCMGTARGALDRRCVQKSITCMESRWGIK